MIVLLVCILILIKFPIKKSIKVEFDTIPQEKLSEKDEVLICRYSTTTGPQWEVIGKNHSLFDKQIEYIIVKGNFNYSGLNWDLLDSMSDNKFILQGRFTGKEKFSIQDVYGETYMVFDVEKWTIAYYSTRIPLLNTETKYNGEMIYILCFG